MGGTHRLAALAAVSQSRSQYNRTQPVSQTEMPYQYSVNVLFVSATICGVLVAVCAACWRRSTASNKPDDAVQYGGVYTVSGDDRLQVPDEIQGPPPAYDSVVDHGASANKDCTLEEVVSEPCPDNQSSDERPDTTEPPSYEAAVLLRDTKL